MKIGRLIGNPYEEFGDSRFAPQTVNVQANPGKFGIGEIGMKRSVANRMNRHDITPFATFGNRMVILNPFTKLPPAKPAAWLFVHFVTPDQL